MTLKANLQSIRNPGARKLKRQPSLAHFIHYMDKLVGRLLGEVDVLGIRENTYVVFMFLGASRTSQP